VVNRCDRPVGRSIYTPLLTPEGGIRADLTVQRLAENRFRVVTGAFDGARDAAWFRRHLPADGSVQFEDRSAALCTIGVWGPRAEALLSRIADIPLSQKAFPYGTGGKRFWPACRRRSSPFRHGRRRHGPVRPGPCAN